MTYNMHAGHCPAGKGAIGAVGILNESNEARKVKNRAISALRNAGNKVYDCTCDFKTTKQGCIDAIVTKCNEHKVNLDISIHLNSGRSDFGGDGKTGGVEVWCYSSKTAAIANKICENISSTMGITNRGVKYSQSLQVLRKTESPAILIECCFVDDRDDANKWNAEKCGDAIACAIAGTHIKGTTNSPTPSVQTPSHADTEDIRVDGLWGMATTAKAQCVFGTVADGIVSNQDADYKRKNPGLCNGWEWEENPGKNGSMLIKAIQHWLGVTDDGYIGPKTITALQEKLGCKVCDGYFSDESPAIKKFQEWLNKQ